MRWKLLVACNNKPDTDGLSNIFSNLEEIDLLLPYRIGESLWERIRNEEPDAILLDLFLPGEDTLILLDRIAGIPPERRPSVFLLSALSDDRLLCLVESKALYCFIKPLRYELVQLRTLQLLHAANGRKEWRPKEPEALDNVIAQCIRSLGVPPHLKGYHYTMSAVRRFLIAENPLLLSVTNDIYPAVAKEFDTEPPLVEHAIRNAIEIAWTRGNLDCIHRYFGYTVNDHKGKPSNLEFIAMIAEHIRHERPV